MDAATPIRISRDLLLAKGSIPPPIIQDGNSPFTTAYQRGVAHGWTQGYEDALADLERLGVLRLDSAAPTYSGASTGVDPKVCHA